MGGGAIAWKEKRNLQLLKRREIENPCYMLVNCKCKNFTASVAFADGFRVTECV